jgi:hypothetical protein
VNVHAVLRECATDLLSTEPHVTVDQVVGCAYRRHGDAFADAQHAMVLAAARTIVAKLMRDLSDDDGQQTFDLGDLELPSAIAVQHPDGTYYVRADKATWDELMAGREVRTANVVAAQAKLAAYDESCDVLRPFMEGTERTVADAARIIAETAA